MSSELSELETLRLKLKSETKQKLHNERQLYKLRNVERSYCDDFHLTKSEIDHMTEQLEDLKDKISETSYTIARIDIEKSAERSKFETCKHYLNLHRKEFQYQFDRENLFSELRNKEALEREERMREQSRQKEKQVQEKNEQQLREAEAIDEESMAIERECAVLKKRNNAIMLKLRRKLVETEEARRDLMKRHGGNGSP